MICTFIAFPTRYYSYFDYQGELIHSLLPILNSFLQCLHSLHFSICLESGFIDFIVTNYNLKITHGIMRLGVGHLFVVFRHSGISGKNKCTVIYLCSCVFFESFGRDLIE